MAETKKRRKRAKSASGGRTTPSKSESSRYTPPAAQMAQYKPTPKWVPIFMFGFFGLGVAMIILNYLPGAPILPGDTSNWYLLGGLGLICLGFVAATRYR